MNTAPVIACKDLTKCYKSGEQNLTVLEQIDFTLHPQDTCAVVGPSGSGKTTLLALCAGLDTASRGSVTLDGHDLASLHEDERAKIRRERCGFVFQNFQLIPTLTALENVMVPLELSGRAAKEDASAILSSLGLGERLKHYPHQLSGGEQQRVAMARAFANQPRILFADEPTGNLDLENAEAAFEAMLSLNRDLGTAILLVTHDSHLAQRLSRQIHLRRGRIVG